MCRKSGVIKICWKQVETLQLQSFHTKFQSEWDLITDLTF